MESIEAGPHYEIPSTELAHWLETEAANSWWNVDGDPLLTGRIPFPCPTDELVPELHRINRPILVQATKGDTAAKGQRIDAGKLAHLVTQFASNIHSSGPQPNWVNDRLFYLCWKGSKFEWLLYEDSVTADQFRRDAIPGLP